MYRTRRCTRRSKDRKPGGQRGHPGSGLEFAPVSELADTVPVEPAECSTCGECLDSNAPGEGFTPVQQWDVPPVTLRKVQFDLMRRRCSAGHLTQAPAPAGVSGPVCYGPNVRAFAAHTIKSSTSPWTSTSSGPTTQPSRRSGWPSSKPRSAGAGAACEDSPRSAASVPTSPRPKPTASRSSQPYATPFWAIPGASPHQHDHQVTAEWTVPAGGASEGWSGAGRAVTPATACGVARCRGWLPGSPVMRCGVARSRRSAG